MVYFIVGVKSVHVLACVCLCVLTMCTDYWLSLSQGGPYHDVLHSVLGAYTCYRPDVGYVSTHTRAPVTSYLSDIRHSRTCLSVFMRLLEECSFIPLPLAPQSRANTTCDR